MPNFNADGTQQTRGYRTVRSIGNCAICGRELSLYPDGTVYRHLSPNGKSRTCEGSSCDPAPR